MPKFSFTCQRSGNCCKTGHGYVWVEECDLEAMAAAKGMELAAFINLHVSKIGDRLSIREGAHGRCSLLEGKCECSVYAARPQQCRDFPFWDKLKSDPELLERTARYCPGLKIEC